ncbi:MAG: VCBS repeat-containing protein, partial [Gammaproteobacteria bacterium]|nr:VCBS repeat-containing protein [Gammaproteobacteria bacterium]
MKCSLIVLLFLLCIILSASAYEPQFDTRIDYPAGNATYSVFMIDLNGDGNIDMVTANYASNSVSVLLNNGDGTFQDAVDYGVKSIPYSVFSIDLDNDGDNDLAVAKWSAGVTILKNNGDGTFQHAGDYDAYGASMS